MTGRESRPSVCRQQSFSQNSQQLATVEVGHASLLRVHDARLHIGIAEVSKMTPPTVLRAHAIDGLSATVSAERHGYSRAAFYLITTAFDQGGMRGLLDDPRGRRGPLKLTAELMEFVASADPTLSGRNSHRRWQRALM
jgi:hypothetical protein